MLEYMTWLRTVKSLVGASVKRHRVSIRKFFQYLTDENLVLTVNPTALLDGPHSDVPLPTVITPEQVDFTQSSSSNIKGKGQ